MMLSPAKQNNGRLSQPRRLARSFDRIITVCQEWLEGPDGLWMVASAVLLIFALYITVHLVLKTHLVD